jgi:hypothetical protein
MRCGYIASQRCNFKNHLNRKNICYPLLEDISIENVKMKYGFIKLDNDPQNSSLFPQNSSLFPQNSSFSPPQNSSLFPQNSSLFPQNSSLFPQNNENNLSNSLICKFCNKNCSRSDNLKRHLKTCKKKKEYEILLDEKNKEITSLKTHLVDKDNIHNKITNNINNINNTNNTNNNTIIINNYGEENIEHINKKYLLNLFSKTHRAIPLLVEKIHFDPKHPENQNIKLPNKKLPYIKIRKNDKWQFVDRKSEILNLIDAMCFILSENYQTMELKGKKNLNQNQINVIEKYLDKYRNDDKELMKELENIVDLTLINNSL